MDTILQVFQQEWALRALIASTMVGLTCGVLGCFIVLRNMALIGDALSHAILPGVVFAFMIVGYSVVGFFTGSVIAGLLAAVIITWIQQRVKTKNDAAIGIVFTAMFSIGVMGISWISRNEGVHLDLKDFLFGNVLGVANQDLILSGLVTVFVLYSIVLLYRPLFVTTFQPIIAQTMGFKVERMHYFLMLLLSFAVVAALQTVGVILVVAMLITPAATALLLAERLPWVLGIAGLIGLLSAVLGLYLAIEFETTPGPAMAVVATLFYLMAVFFSPKKGLLGQTIRKRRLQQRIQAEDFLKQSLKLEQREQLNKSNLQENLGFSRRVFGRIQSLLRRKGLLDNDGYHLTTEGRKEANRLVRAHRLWETYLVDQMGLSAENIHEEAERYEHLLTEDLLDEVEAELGYPTIDPHGSPIPRKAVRPERSLLSLAKNDHGRIALKQIDEHITAQLWQLGVLPDTEFVMRQLDSDFVEIEQEDRHIRISKSLAGKVSVASREQEATT
ncbi:MAG: iron chelate uptake ABC transporter family permease subunit [Bacteroidetes bacterium]|nr:iron chelate uptake ABC transporter family permease subunit [Bacteroidota bacterium]